MANEQKLDKNNEMLQWIEKGCEIAEANGYDGAFLSWMVYSVYLIKYNRDNSFISPQDFLQKMKKIDELSDKEMRHIYADRVLCETLAQFGYNDGIEIFEKMHKWYA